MLQKGGEDFNGFPLFEGGAAIAAGGFSLISHTQKSPLSSSTPKSGLSFLTPPHRTFAQGGFCLAFQAKRIMAKSAFYKITLIRAVCS